MKQLLFILLLALGIQTQAQTLHPISNIKCTQEGCLLNVAFDCAACSDADILQIYYFDPLVGQAGLWIEINVTKSVYGAYENVINIPLCTTDTSLHSPGMICNKDGVTYRVTTVPSYGMISGRQAFIKGRYSVATSFTIPVLSSPDCVGAAPPEPVIATPAKKKGGKK